NTAVKAVVLHGLLHHQRGKEEQPNFVQLAFNTLINKIKYSVEGPGITVLVIDESIYRQMFLFG
ncbi:MAG: hypothetical protein QXN66_06390, partial [Thermoplasmatales archaeon]